MGISTSWAERHPAAAALEGADPGPELVAALVALVPADLDDEALIEVVAAWERTASWALALQGAAVAELHRRREAQGTGEFVADEVAVRLACTRRAGQTKVGLALAMDRMPTLDDALRTGALDARKAMVLTDDLAHLPDHEAEAVARSVLPEASCLTAPQLHARLRRLELEQHPDAAEARHRRASRDRHVELTAVADSMAWLSAYLPADDATAIHTSLTALADQAAPDDPRSLDERRADALVDLAVRWLDAGATPHGPLVTRQGRRPHLQVVASASTLLAMDDHPAELAGYGPIPAPMARRIAARSTWTPVLVDARTGAPLARSTRRYAPTESLRVAVTERDATCTFPGCRVPAVRCDLDHVVPFDPRHASPGSSASAPGTDGSPPGGSPPDAPPPHTSPPPASPPHGSSAGVPSHDASPPHGSSVGVPSHDASPPGGPPLSGRRDDAQTSVDNLHSLCRHHHRAKTHGGWSVTRDGEGTYWLTPTGREHVRPAAHRPPPVSPIEPPPGVRIDIALPARGRTDGADATRPRRGPGSSRDGARGPSDLGPPPF